MAWRGLASPTYHRRRHCRTVRAAPSRMVGLKRATSPDTRFAAKRFCGGIHAAEAMEFTVTATSSGSDAMPPQPPDVDACALALSYATCLLIRPSRCRRFAGAAAPGRHQVVITERCRIHEAHRWVPISPERHTRCFLPHCGTGSSAEDPPRRDRKECPAVNSRTRKGVPKVLKRASGD